MTETKHAHPVTVIPYLSFRGNCEEALNTYIEAFGGEIFYLSRWSKETYDVTPEQIGKVMHAEFVLGNTRMAAGDTYDSERINTAIKLMIHMDSKEDASQTISVLSKEGTIISPLHSHPEPDDSGCGSITRDRFGYILLALMVLSMLCLLIPSISAKIIDTPLCLPLVTKNVSSLCASLKCEV